MANNLTGSVIYLDTFSADVTLFTGCEVMVKGITFRGANSDKLVLEDERGHIVADIIMLANTTTVHNIPFKSQGLKVDVSDGTYSGGGTNSQVALIYV